MRPWRKSRAVDLGLSCTLSFAADNANVKDGFCDETVQWLFWIIYACVLWLISILLQSFLNSLCTSPVICFQSPAAIIWLMYAWDLPCISRLPFLWCWGSPSQLAPIDLYGVCKAWVHVNDFIVALCFNLTHGSTSDSRILWASEASRLKWSARMWENIHRTEGWSG